MNSRRNFLASAGALLTAATVSRAAQGAVPEAPTSNNADTMPPLMPPDGRLYNPVVTLNSWTLPWRMNNGWKEFHLVAEPVRRQIAPGMTAQLWGYNGQSPGPTIECVEGDKLRIFVTNKLPEHTTIHWHGILLPNGMDGVGGLNQPQIPVGKTFVYEFEMKKSGTFMYHPHADEMVQMAMGMMGFFVVHPKNPALHRVDRDFVFLINAFDIEPGAAVPKVNTMLDQNLWCWNSRAFPGISPFVVRKGDRVRIRFGNLTMTNHPIHMHGYDFKVSCTDGGWVRPEARWPEVTVHGDMSDFHLVFPEYADRLHWAENGERFDLGGTEIVVVESVFRDLVYSRWFFDTKRHALFPGDGFAYAHHHEEGACGHLAEEVPEMNISEEMKFFAEVAFHWTNYVDIDPYIARLRELMFDELDVWVVAPTHGLPIGDPRATMPTVEAGMRTMRRADHP